MSETLAAALALLPGLLRWAWGRRLVRSADDPTLPERLVAWRQGSVIAFATAAALLIVLLPRQAAWALPLLLLAELAGGFPARRALYQERWGLVAYVAFVVRLTLGLGGFWLLLLAAPALVAGAGAARWPVAVTLAVVLVGWGLAQGPALRWLLGATPLARPELEERLRAIAARSKAPQPRLLVIGPGEGRWANAFALPATRRPAVAFTRTLLESLDADELAAIFAHEQAHLEHFDAARMRRLAAVQTLAALVATLGAAAAVERFEDAGFGIGLGWALVVAMALLLRAVRHRAHEAESDRRAAELCRDPRALARALARLHALALLPRRLSVEQERWATHPSLANRLRALEALAEAGGRSASGPEDADSLAGATLAAPVSASTDAGGPAFVVAGAAAGSWVLLDARHAHWLEGVPPATPRDAGLLRAAAPRLRTLAYSELVELRLRPRGRDGHALVATDRGGASWSLPLAAGEGAAAHAALDAVDGRLAPHAAARPEHRGPGALVACTGVLLATLMASAAALPALVALVLAQPGPLAGFGAAAVGAGLGGLAAGPSSAPWVAPRLAPLASLGLLLLGILALRLARSTAWREHTGRTRSAPWVGLGLALAGLLALTPTGLALGGGGVLRAHLAARDHPAGALLLLAAAASLVVTRRRSCRHAAAGLGALALLPLVLGTRAFAARFVQDPFFAPGARASAVATLTGRLVDEQPLPAVSGELLLSPSGRSWAVRRFDLEAGDAAPQSRMVVDSASRARYEYQASDLVLLDDALLLALFADAQGLAVQQRPHDPAAPALWRTPLPPLAEGVRLAADPATGRWRVVGTDEVTGALVRLEGGGDGNFTVERWTPGAQAAAWLLGSGPAALGIAPRFDAEEEALLAADTEDAVPSWWSFLFGAPAAPAFGSRLFGLGAAGARPLYESQLLVQCDEPGPGTVELLCRAHDGARTSLWRVDPATGERRALAALDGLAWSGRDVGDGWLVLINAGRRQDLYRLRGERLERIDLGGTPPWIHAVAGFDGGVAAVVSDGAGARLRRWQLP